MLPDQIYFLCLAHYNIQPDNMSGRPGVTPSEESWDTGFKIGVRARTLIIVMMADSASEPDIIANDSGLCVYSRMGLCHVKTCCFELPQPQPNLVNCACYRAG